MITTYKIILIFILLNSFTLCARTLVFDSVNLEKQIISYYSAQKGNIVDKNSINILHTTKNSSASEDFYALVQCTKKGKDVIDLFEFKHSIDSLQIRNVFQNVIKNNPENIDSIRVKRFQTKTFFEIFSSFQPMSSCIYQNYYLIEKSKNKVRTILKLKKFEDCEHENNFRKDQKTKNYQYYKIKFESDITFETKKGSKYPMIIVGLKKIKYLPDDDTILNTQKGIIRFTYSTEMRSYQRR